jgi:hypothetical protein
MEKKEASARMSGLRRKKPNEEFNFKIAFCGYNSMYPDSRLKWYAIEFLDPESRRYLYSSSARRKEKENVDVRLIPYSSSARRKEKENVDVRLIPYSSSARRKEKENVDVCKYKKLPYSSFSAKNSPNQVLIPFLVVDKDLSQNTHILMDSHLYTYNGPSVWTLDLNSYSLDWKPVIPMNLSRFRARGLTLDGKLYILGGLDRQSVLGGLEFQSVPPTHGWMEVFDPIVQKWESLPNPPSTTIPSASMICTVLKSKEILVIDDSGSGVSSYSQFYTYNLRTQCWKTLEPRQSRLLCRYRRPVTVGNTLYWVFLERTYSRFGSVATEDVGVVQAYDVDADMWFQGFFNTSQLFKKPEFLLTCNENLLPLIHVADQKFCLLLESCTMCKNPPEFDAKYVNFLVLDIDMHMPDDDDDESVYHKLSVSVRSVQKHILGEHHRCFGFLDAVLL